MKKNSKFLTDEEVEAEIERLSKSEAVALAQYDHRLKCRRLQYLYHKEKLSLIIASETVGLAENHLLPKCRRRQALYHLRSYEKKGKALLEAGFTREILDAIYNTEGEQ